MKRMAVGHVSLERKMEGSKRLAEHAFYFTTPKAKTKVAILPARHVSDAADFVEPDTKLIIGFSYTVEEGTVKMLFSMRTRNGYDCAKLAVAHGGGGHTAAAGFQLPMHETAVNPYTLIRGVVERFEER